MITKQQALTEYEFHYGTCVRTVGPRGGVTERVERWRRNGATQTWKSRPTEFRIPVKFGLRFYGNIFDFEADKFHVALECPLNAEVEA